MQNRKIKPYILDTHTFRMIMREVKELRDISNNPKYSLRNSESLELYNLWAPYIMDGYSQTTMESPGFKIQTIEMMSMLLVLKDEKNNCHRFKVNEIEKINLDQHETNVIDFMKYKRMM